VRIQIALPEGRTLTNLVVMGMGESQANLENLIAALEEKPEWRPLTRRTKTEN